MKKSRAFCLLRDKPFYRRDAFMQGLALAGFEPIAGVPWWPARPGDVLVIWNRYGESERMADCFEAEGGTVLVAENGYLGKGGSTPKEDVCGPRDGGYYYALARHAHNGRGWWPDGDGSRFNALGVQPKPWREGGEYILICANRSFGQRAGIMPHGWADTIKRTVRQGSSLPIRVREHPGNVPPDRSLEKDLAGAAAVVIWSSSCGIHALMSGIPVVSYAPWWICKPAASADMHVLNASGPARQRALDRMAWAQWTIDEIASGQPFTLLCGTSTHPATCTA